jgi:hypothetical protein
MGENGEFNGEAAAEKRRKAVTDAKSASPSATPPPQPLSSFASRAKSRASKFKNGARASSCQGPWGTSAFVQLALGSLFTL